MEHPISRMPSIYAIQSYLRVFNSQSTNSVYNGGVDSEKTYYVVNPGDNLPFTESVFKPIFSR